MRSLLCSFLLALPAFAADPPVSPIRLPNVPVVFPAPLPSTAVLKLSAEVYYIVESDSPAMILSSPEGIVSVTTDQGPIRLRGKFIDGTGKVETRTYKSKYVYTVEQIGVGHVELLIFAVGEPDASKVKRVQLLVGDVKPIPPPVPVPDPIPVPVPILTPFQTKLRAAIVADAGTPEQLGRYAEFYRSSSQTVVQDEGLKTSGELTNEMLAILAGMKLPKGSLATTARTIADELNTILPRPANTPLGTKNSTVRNLYATTYARIATDLETAGGK